VTILRMYYTPNDTKRPTHYREAWWEEETQEFILHHGQVGEPGTTTVENVANETEADLLLASFAKQNTTDNYIDVDELEQEHFTVIIQQKRAAPTEAEQQNAEKFARQYSGLLAWRGLGTIEEWETNPERAAFEFHISSVHRSKAAKYAREALKKTDFRADRMSIERE